ncbi:hypothetical protein IFR05_000063 [Cadophora sp. M221]|nr:hypothetical protein IFR05_000063 [Cadophora sp. M221]
MSPGYYRRDISPRNPLYYLTPFPVSSSSARSTPLTESTTTNQEMKHENGTVGNDTRAHAHTSKLPPVVPLPDPNFDLEWPPLSDEDTIPT